ncbi:MAG: flagellar motor protein MotA [Alphaproteobacteria bacterium]|nr:flagellar motor protein MotA [Alphaproteobacteria bacterium]
MTGIGLYLTRMLLFLLVVAVAGFALYQGLSGAFMANVVLNGIIVAVFVFGVLITFRMVLVLRPEIRWIEDFRADQPAETQSPPPRLLSPMSNMLGERREKMSLSATSTRSMLDSISARLDESRDISRYMIGVLIFLGLLGTFWGLLQTVTSVGQAITSLNFGSGDFAVVFEDLKVSLEAPLSGMGTAFSSSLFGLAGSLILGFLDLQASQAQNRFYNDLEEWLSGLTRLSSGGFLAEGDQSVPAYIQALLEQTAESLSNLQRIMESGEERQASTGRSMLQLTEQLGTLNDQLRAQQDLQIKMAQRQAETGVDEATRAHIRNLEIYMSRILEELSTGRPQMTEDLRREIKLLARTVGAQAERVDG